MLLGARAEVGETVPILAVVKKKDTACTKMSSQSSNTGQKLSQLRNRLIALSYGASDDGELVCAICYESKDIGEMRPMHPPQTPGTKGIDIFRSNYVPPANGSHNTLQHYVCTDCMQMLATCPSCGGSKSIDWTHITRHEAHYGLPGIEKPIFNFKLVLRHGKFVCISSAGAIVMILHASDDGTLILTDTTPEAPDAAHIVMLFPENDALDWCFKHTTINVVFVFERGDLGTYILMNDEMHGVHSERYRDVAETRTWIPRLWHASK